MTNKTSISRRNFMKSTAAISTGFIGVSAFSSCTSNDRKEKKTSAFPAFSIPENSGYHGLLFSQVGYELGLPIRVIVRLPKKDQLPGNASCKLVPVDAEKSYEAEFIYWGEIWGSHWWVASFKNIQEPGEWDIQVKNGRTDLISDSGLKVEKDILWKSTIEWSSVDMLERRRHFTGLGVGWQDAGTKWVESPAQSTMIIALEELLEKKQSSFDENFLKRIYTQIECGCDYLVLTQKKAAELGFPKGAMSHDTIGHEKDILPNDASKAVVALAKAFRLLPDSFSDQKQRYEKAAAESFEWLVKTAKPMGDYGYVKMQRGISNETIIPKDEWLTRDLLMLCQASIEMYKNGNNEAKQLALEFAKKVMARQIPKGNAQSGFFGNFYEFDSLKHAEPSWVHGIVPDEKGSQFGADMGGIYPNYLVPLIELLKLFPDHEDAENWKLTLKNFTYGYLIPGCEANPFYLVPQGIFGNEGPIWFCGTFHGTNVIYGYTAALALELEKLFTEPKLKEIAYGNLQWLAGLNAGITAENIKTGCVLFSTDLPENLALPASMICHIGKRWAGTWFQTRGVICNGFSTGKQFVYDTEPKKANDGPNSFTDEDWIPHSAAWLTGLMRL